MYATGALNLLVRVDASNFVPCVRRVGHVRGVRGPKSTVPFPVPGGSARPGPYASSMSFLFIIVQIPSLVGTLSRPKSHVLFPKISQPGVVVSRA